jgi:serine protease
MPLKKLSVVLAGIILASSAAIAQIARETAAPGEVLVKFRRSAPVTAERAAHFRSGAVVAERFADLGWQRVRLPANVSIGEAIQRYRSSPEVEAVQPNYYYRLLATPNDPSFGSLYGLAKINAPQAWDIHTGTSAVVVANIDTGIKYDHEDLAANMWKNTAEVPNNGVDDDGNGFVDDHYGWDFFFDDPDPADENGHGTHTAGTIGAVGNNGIGVAGVNWNVRIMAIKIYSSSGFGTTSGMLINAYNYVRMMKQRGVNIRVTNNSYGGCDEACGYDQATKDAIDALGDAGVLQVFAAGNEGRNIDGNGFYPASYTSPSIVSVANSNADDNRNLSSNFGIVDVDVAAPGTSILSTVPSGYGNFTGTSMAAPHVAGAAALLASFNPSLSAASLKATLLNTVSPLQQWAGVVKTGGRLNAANALQNQTLCSFVPDTTLIDAPTKGGTYTVQVTAANNCDYAVRSSARWVYVASGDAMSSNGTITLRVGLNTTVSRTATVSVGGQLVTIRQSRSGVF